MPRSSAIPGSSSRIKPPFFARYKQKVLATHHPESLIRQYLEVRGHRLDVMVSEIIPGDETKYVLCACHLNDRGEVLAEACMRKIRQHPAEFGVGSVIKSIPMIEEVREASWTLLRDCRYTGFSATEYKWDPLH